MAEVRYEGRCCECCLLMIVNGDESGCRDYYGHTHRPASLSEETERELSAAYPQFDQSEWEWNAFVVGDSQGTHSLNYCELCDSELTYTYTFYVIR